MYLRILNLLLKVKLPKGIADTFKKPMQRWIKKTKFAFQNIKK